MPNALPSSTADRLPNGPDWVHEIEHDGYRLMARPDPPSASVRKQQRPVTTLPVIVETMNQLKVWSCLIDGGRRL